MSEHFGQMCRWFHKWREAAWDGLFSIAKRCEKCGWYRVTNVILDETQIVHPARVKIESEGR